jgi:hypothetical protein
MLPGKSRGKSCVNDKEQSSLRPDETRTFHQGNRSFSNTVSAQKNKPVFGSQSLFHRLNAGYSKKALLEG